MNEREADIVAAFVALKGMCDKRGHGLLRVLEELALDSVVSSADYRDFTDAQPPSNVVPLDSYSRRVFACDPDESVGLARRADMWDPGK